MKCSNCGRELVEGDPNEEMGFELAVSHGTQAYQIATKVDLCAKCPDAAMLRGIELCREFIKKVEA